MMRRCLFTAAVALLAVVGTAWGQASPPERAGGFGQGMGSGTTGWGFFNTPGGAAGSAPVSGTRPATPLGPGPGGTSSPSPLTSPAPSLNQPGNPATAFPQLSYTGSYV